MWRFGQNYSFNLNSSEYIPVFDCSVNRWLWWFYHGK